MRYGDWNVIPDSVYGYIFRYIKHVIKPFPVPGNWEIWRGGDDGFASPAAIYWITQNPDTGTFYVINEIYQSGLLPHRLAYKILQRDRSIKVSWGSDIIENNEEQLNGDLDSAAFSDTGTGTPSRGKQMNDKGCCWRPVDKIGGGGRSFREMRVHMLHMLLAPNPKERINPKYKEHQPGIMFFDICVNAIRTIPTLVRDDNNIEDIDTEGEDHAFDAITYALTRKKRMFVEEKVYGI
jgi:hypothetical protein